MASGAGGIANPYPPREAILRGQGCSGIINEWLEDESELLLIDAIVFLANQSCGSIFPGPPQSGV